MTRKVSYHWHLRRLMADRGMFATTALAEPLAERGISLSREQVYRLVTGIPERLSLATLVALCDILGCGPGDIIEPVASPGGKQVKGAGAGTAAPPAARSGARRAAPVMAAAGCPAGHQLTSHGLRRPCAACRRDALIQYVITAEGSLPASEIAAAVDAVATSPAVLRDLAAALAADRDMLRHGAPPVAGRLAGELIARGSATLTPGLPARAAAGPGCR